VPKSAVTLQNFVDNAMAFGDLKPVLTASGYSLEPATTAMNDAMNGFLADYPYKFNTFDLPQFYTNSWQQDYALVNPNGTTLTNLSWLQRGICININSTAIPKPWSWVEVGRDQTQSTASLLSNNFFSAPIFKANWLPNNDLYYGTWGAANTGNATFGNNPVANSVYTNPLGASSQPFNPITQIIDANGNYLLLTTYGTEGSTAPLAATNAAPGTTVSGTGASTVWTVLDPYGQGIRITPVPSQTGCVWQFNLVGQMLPIRFNAANGGMKQSIFPVTDEYEPHLRALFVAQLYRYSEFAKVRAKFQAEWDLAMKSLIKARMKSDRERDFYRFVASRSVKTGSAGISGYVGPYWPYGGPPR
jgi:hypothetical protein